MRVAVEIIDVANVSERRGRLGSKASYRRGGVAAMLQSTRREEPFFKVLRRDPNKVKRPGKDDLDRYDMGVSMHRLLDISLEKGTVVVDTSPANFVHAATRDRSMVLSLAAFPYAALLQLRRWSATGSIRFKLSTPADVEDRDVFDANRLEAESSGVLKLLAEAPRHGVVIDGRDRLMQALYISGVIEAVEGSVGA